MYLLLLGALVKLFEHFYRCGEAIRKSVKVHIVVAVTACVIV